MSHHRRPLLVYVLAILLVLGHSFQILHKGSKVSDEHSEEDVQRYIKEQYAEMQLKKQKEGKKGGKKGATSSPESTKSDLKKPPEGITPSKLGLKRPINSTVEITNQVKIPNGVFWFGSQLESTDKAPMQRYADGSGPRKKILIKEFLIDVDCVTNAQFEDFVTSTNYVTEAELYSWSFVLEIEASAQVVAQADSPTGFGRVKSAPHWLAVPGADWRHPLGPDSSITDRNNDIYVNSQDSIGSLSNYPVVQVSHKDASEYCKWTGRRLPSEKEWEYASRGGFTNYSYPWGKRFKPNHMNIWDGKFPQANKRIDGYLGLAPTLSYSPNKYGVYNTVGNVWEWVAGGSADKRIQRGGSYIDSVDGSFNHPAYVSTRQENTGDSAGSNSGFRCASSVVKVKPIPSDTPAEATDTGSSAGTPPDSLNRAKKMHNSKKSSLKDRKGKTEQEL